MNRMNLFAAAAAIALAATPAIANTTSAKTTTMHKSVSTQATPRHAAVMHRVGKVRHERTTAMRSAGLPASVAKARPGHWH